MEFVANFPNESSQLNKPSKRDSQIIFALCVILFVPGINNFLNSFLQIGLSLSISFLTPIAYIFMALISVIFLYRLVLRKKVFLGVFVFFLIAVLVSYWRYPEIRSAIYSSPVDLVYSPVNKLFFYCLPSLYGIACLSDYNTLFDKMRIWCRLSVITGIFTYIFCFFYAHKSLQYMVYSYFMLLPICVCFEHARVKKSVFDWLIAIIGSVCVVLCGARGAVLSLILYFVTRILLQDLKRVSIGKVVSFFGIIIGFILVYLFYNELLSFVVDLFEMLGVNSRFVSKLEEGKLIIDNSGRSNIANAIFEGIKHNPLGYGLYGDRYVTGNFGFGANVYAHNIIYEVLCDFGIAFGVVILGILAWRLMRTVLILKSRKEIHLLLVLLPYGVYQLFFSSSCLENIPFFIIMGLCFFVNWRKLPDNR